MEPFGSESVKNYIYIVLFTRHETHSGVQRVFPRFNPTMEPTISRVASSISAATAGEEQEGSKLKQKYQRLPFLTLLILLLSTAASNFS